MKTKTPTKPKAKRVRPTLAAMKRLRQRCESEERVIRDLQESRDRCHETNTRLAKEVHDLTVKLGSVEKKMAESICSRQVLESNFTPATGRPERTHPGVRPEGQRELAAVERERTQYRLMHEASLMLRSRPRKLTLWERLTGWVGRSNWPAR